VWLQFFLVAGAITVAGSRLPTYGDVLAEKTGMGRTWLGLVVLAAGNLFGSNLVNLGILGLMGLVYVKAPWLQVVSSKHLGTGVMAIIMTGIAAAEMMYRPQKKVLRWMSLGAFSLVFLYAAHIFVQMLAA
jgi:cation:H+ antiporter